MTFWKWLFRSKTREAGNLRNQAGSVQVHNVTIPSQRLFSSDIQKSRRPIKDPQDFNRLVAEFHQEQGRQLHAAITGKPLSFEEALESGQRMLALADRLIEMEPTRGIPWMLRCNALGILGRTSEALIALDHAIDIDPSDSDKWELRVTILKQLGRYKEADDSAAQLRRLRNGSS